ncbi:MAG: diguanylate cyclase [Planctomycetia bacterium]|nr:diguanylate cyclase [Planctomycetia bacterium]
MSTEMTAVAENMNPTTPAAAILVWIDDAELQRRVLAVSGRIGALRIAGVEELLAEFCEAAVVVVDEATRSQLAELVATNSLPYAVATVCLGDDAGSPEAEASILAESFGADSPVDVYLPLDASDGELLRALRSTREIAGLRARLRQVHLLGGEWARLAATDPLTELPNRRGWNDLFTRLVERSARDAVPLCVAIVDLDEFKRANDEEGHAVGDDVLRAVAEAFRSTVRAGDFCARLGGDEFGLLLSGMPEANAEQAFGRIRSAATKLLVERGLPAVTCSFGYAMATSPEDYSVEGLFEAADAALRQAKREGRNRVHGGTSSL